MAAVTIAATLILAACGAATPGDTPSDPMTSESMTSEPMESGSMTGEPMEDESMTGEPMESESMTGEPTDTMAPEGAGSSSAAPEALRFSAKTLDGRTFEGASLAGKPVVFWFWAPWCPKCRSDAPAVKAAAAEHSDVAFVGVAGLDSEAAMKEFVSGTGTGGLVHLSDEQGAVWTKLGVAQQSVFVFMTPGGDTTKVTGPLGRDGIDAEVAKIKAG